MAFWGRQFGEAPADNAGANFPRRGCHRIRQSASHPGCPRCHTNYTHRYDYRRYANRTRICAEPSSAGWQHHGTQVPGWLGYSRETLAVAQRALTNYGTAGMAIRPRDAFSVDEIRRGRGPAAWIDASALGTCSEGLQRCVRIADPGTAGRAVTGAREQQL